MQADSRRGRAALALWMGAGVALALARGQAEWFALVGLAGLWLTAAAGRGLGGAANQVTLARASALALLPLAFDHLPRAVFCALVLALFALDAADGWLARRRGECTPLGALLDMESDAFGVMLLALLLRQEKLAPAWVLAAGLWRYGYALAVAALPLGDEAPRSRLARVIYVALMLCLGAAFLPSPRLAPLAAAAGTALVSFSFLRSLAWSLQSAARRSRAASAQLRGGGSAA